jgi:3-deoxy-D-manno-octulosonic-acid transferase
MPRALYSMLLYLMLPFTPLKLLWRGMKQPEYLRHVPERYGFYPKHLAAGQPLIWLHCVSVGETRAAAPLVHELQKHYPDHRILLTHATPTGRAAGEQLFGDSVSRCYLPYDVPGAVGRFLDHYRPVLGMLMETELWFNLIAGCKRRGIPLLLVNARLSERSAHGYAQVARLTAEGLQGLTAIAAQTEQDAQRLSRLGATNVHVLGNLKFDVEPPPNAAELGALLRAALGKHRPVFLAASTRDGEEQMILDAVDAAQIPNLLTVIVPRHPQRFDEVANMLTKRGLSFMKRSKLKGEIPGQVSVILGDSMGEMFTYYSACDVAFIGGSLQPLGGQNLIEASAMGKPVLIGPHTFNFTAATEQAIAARAAWRVEDVAGLASSLQRLFGDPELRQSMSWAALEFSHSAGGTAQKITSLIREYLR